MTREGALYAFLLGSAAGHVIISGLHLPLRTSVHNLSAGTGSETGGTTGLRPRTSAPSAEHVIVLRNTPCRLPLVS